MQAGKFEPALGLLDQSVVGCRPEGSVLIGDEIIDTSDAGGRVAARGWMITIADMCTDYPGTIVL